MGMLMHRRGATKSNNKTTLADIAPTSEKKQSEDKKVSKKKSKE